MLTQCESLGQCIETELPDRLSKTAVIGNKNPNIANPISNAPGTATPRRLIIPIPKFLRKSAMMTLRMLRHMAFGGKGWNIVSGNRASPLKTASRQRQHVRTDLLLGTARRGSGKQSRKPALSEGAKRPSRMGTCGSLSTIGTGLPPYPPPLRFPLPQFLSPSTLKSRSSVLAAELFPFTPSGAARPGSPTRLRGGVVDRSFSSRRTPGASP